MPTDLIPRTLDLLAAVRLRAAGAEGDERLHLVAAARHLDRALAFLELAERAEMDATAAASRVAYAALNALLAPIGRAMNGALDCACDEMLERVNGERGETEVEA